MSWSPLSGLLGVKPPVELERGEEFHGQRNLVGYCLWGRTELDMTKATQQQQQKAVRDRLALQGGTGDFP